MRWTVTLAVAAALVLPSCSPAGDSGATGPPASTAASDALPGREGNAEAQRDPASSAEPRGEGGLRDNPPSRSPEEQRGEKDRSAETERLRRLVEPVRADVDVLPYVRFPAVGRNVEKARLAVEVSASAFAEAVSYLVSEGDIDSDAVMVPLRGTPIAYPMDSAMIAVAASRRRGVALAVDTFYREVGNRLWTAVFMSSARNESGKVIGLCYGVYVEAAGDGVVIGVEELPISAMVPGTKKISTRMNCLPGEDGVSNPSDLE